VATDPYGHRHPQEPGWDFKVLGALEVSLGGSKIRLGRKQTLLAVTILLAADGRPVSRGELIERIWSDDLQDSTEEDWWGKRHSDLTVIVSRARSAFNAVQPGAGPRFLATYQNSGFSLQAHRSLVDLHRFNDACKAAATAVSDCGRAAALFHTALAEWGGPVAALDNEPLPGLTGRWADGYRDFLREQRLLALLGYYRAELDLGHHEQLLPGLQQLANLDPPNNEAVRLRMLALYRSGRAREARLFFGEYRQQLYERSKQRPGPVLEELYGRIKGQDPDLLWRNQGDGHLVTERKNVTMAVDRPAAGQGSAAASPTGRSVVPAASARPNGASGTAGGTYASSGADNTDSAGRSPAGAGGPDGDNDSQSNEGEQRSKPSGGSDEPGSRATIRIDTQTVDGGVVVFGGTITGPVIGTQNVGLIGAQRNHGRTHDQR